MILQDLADKLVFAKFPTRPGKRLHNELENHNF